MPVPRSRRFYLANPPGKGRAEAFPCFLLGTAGGGCSTFFLVPKLPLGNPSVSEALLREMFWPAAVSLGLPEPSRSLAAKGAPKQELGSEIKG